MMIDYILGFLYFFTFTFLLVTFHLALGSSLKLFFELWEKKSLIEFNL
jgi:hypothetical protein